MSYCRNCGHRLEDSMSGCASCGCPRGMGIGFCEKCGEKLIPGTMYCARCGAPAGMPEPPRPAMKPHKARSRYAAAVYGIVLGAFGVHNFYLGHTGKAIGQLVITLVVYSSVGGKLLPAAIAPVLAPMLAGLWGFIEGVQILVGDRTTDAFGTPLRQWNE